MSEKGLFSRWAQRKQQVQEQEALEQQQALEKQQALESQQTADNLKSAEQVEVTGSEANPQNSQTISSSDKVAGRGLQTAEHQPLAAGETENTPSDKPLSDEDMQDVEAIDGNSNVSAFFSEGVSEKLRKQALKAMFLKPEFNVRDGMDDYDLDYTDVKELSSDVAAGLRKWFKNKDPLDLESASSDGSASANQVETGAEAAAGAATQQPGESENTGENDGDNNAASPESGAEQMASDETQSSASQAVNEGAGEQTASENPAPDQNKTDLASGKATSVDSAPAEQRS